MSTELALSQTNGLENFSWATGQVIGISEMEADPSTIFYEFFTASRYGHVGVVAVEGTEVFVYEEAPPRAQKTPLKSYLDRAHRGGLTVVEPATELSAAQKKNLVQVMDTMVADKVPYNFDIVLKENSFGCAAFVQKVFEKIGIPGVGRIETIGDMNLRSLNGKLIKIYQKPNLPVDAPVITPAAVMNSLDMKPAFIRLPLGRLLSDHELGHIWIEQGGVGAFVKKYNVNPESAEKLNRLLSGDLEPLSKEPYRPYPPSWKGSCPALHIGN